MSVLVTPTDGPQQVHDDSDGWAVTDDGNLQVTKGGTRVAEWHRSAWMEARHIERTNKEV